MMEPPPPRPPRDAGGSASPSSGSAFVAACGPFAAPARRVASPATLAAYALSPARADLLGFVRALAEAVRGVTLTEQVPESPAIAALVGMLETMEARCLRSCSRHTTPEAFDALRAQGWVAEIPPATQAMRYGNTAFRTWCAAERRVFLVFR